MPELLSITLPRSRASYHREHVSVSLPLTLSDQAPPPVPTDCSLPVLALSMNLKEVVCILALSPSALSAVSPLLSCSSTLVTLPLPLPFPRTGLTCIQHINIRYACAGSACGCIRRSAIPEFRAIESICLFFACLTLLPTRRRKMPKASLIAKTDHIANIAAVSSRFYSNLTQ